MLLELHIKNLALIQCADLEFYTGLTVLSGETGAGKSVLIDSVNLALGAKAGKDMIRSGEESAYIELLFSIEDEKKLEKIRELDIEVGEEGLIAVSRRISENKSVMRVNGELVQAAKLRKLAGFLLDMHSQHEHQSLMNTAKHLELIDLFAAKEIFPIKEELARVFKEYEKVKALLAQLPEESIRLRETEILQYEIREIEEASPKEEEEEELAARYKRFRSSAKILEILGRASNALEEERISASCKEMREIAGLDFELENLASSLSEIDMLLSEASRSIGNYLESFEYNEEEFERIGRRLDLIRRLKAKYAQDIGQIYAILEKKKERLSFLQSYEEKEKKWEEEKEKQIGKMEALCLDLSKQRAAAAKRLQEKITKELLDLNFLDVKFEVRLSGNQTYGANGRDEAEFLISTNPGQPIKPLKDVASGGEMSRIMLAIKTVLADMDEVDTLIFDEVDAGISGRTAQKVSEKLSLIGRKHQVISITHLPQIAAMADHHYLISKHSDGRSTMTDIEYIKKEEIVKELSRLIGGSEITDAVLDTAREMKALAAKYKSNLEDLD
ncbi:MAG: DNA repair protein RecN [Johnsonella sp.]|nr:DNA repair protein RecN [Johnsonella sp.]